MNQLKKRRTIGLALVVLGLFGLSAGGCLNDSTNNDAGSDGKQMPTHIEVPANTAAVLMLAKEGDVKRIEVPTDTVVVLARRAEEEGAVELIELIAVTQARVDPQVITEEDETYQHPGHESFTNTSTTNRRCLFSYNGSNGKQWYKEPCIH